MSLYKILGVKKGASRDEIRAAYRNKAKESHPDKGGDDKKFMEFAKAYKILVNSDSRDRYDETGAVEDVNVINRKANAMVSSIFENIIDEVGEEGALKIDIVRKIGNVLTKTLAGIVAEITAGVSRKKAVEEIAKRIKHKDKNNLLSVSIRNRLDNQVNHLNILKERKEITKTAKDIFKGYVFKFDTVPEGTHRAWATFNTFTTSSVTL